MTLNYKYCDLIDSHNGYDNKLHADRCEQIADEFAIEFLQWYFSNEGDDLIHDLILVGEVDKNTTIKELLEIYKKEKGL